MFTHNKWNSSKKKKKKKITDCDFERIKSFSAHNKFTNTYYIHTIFKTK